MKRLLILASLILLLTSVAFAQQSMVTSFTETIATAPAAVVTGQNFSNAASTGASTSSIGGTVAAGTYRICVTFFTSANTETPCSTDTAATSTITTTGSASTVTVYPPFIQLTGAGNIVGYRVYVGANGGAAGAETLQTLNSTVCVLSVSGTASCALSSPAVFTSSSNFTGGSGGPASPGTALYPPIANQANMALFENGNYPTQIVTWVNSGTSPSACTFNIQTGATVAALASVGQTITCTSSGSYALPSAALPIYVSINLASYTAGGTNTTTLFTLTTLPYPLPYYWGNAAPSGTCLAGATFDNTAGGVSTTLYTCSAGTWTAVTVP